MGVCLCVCMSVHVCVFNEIIRKYVCTVQNTQNGKRFGQAQTLHLLFV